MRRRLFAAPLQAADFSLIVDGAEYKIGDTVTILASTNVTVKGTAKAEVTLIGGGGGGGDYVGDSSYNYNTGGMGGNGGTSIFKQELSTGTFSVTVGVGGRGAVYGYGEDGGSTIAFGHTAGGGGGGSPADDWGDGAYGYDGIGETASGNNTQYGRGGDGTYYPGADSGTSGACLIKLIDPNLKFYTVTLSGSFDTSNAYVTINGGKFTTAGTHEVEEGTIITLAIKKQMSNGTGGIEINGEKVIIVP